MYLAKYFSIVAQTHIGHRELNQDSYAYLEEPESYSVCIMVADGLGGHVGGEIASQTLLFHLKQLLPSYAEYFKQDPISATESLVQDACHALRQTIREQFGNLDAHTTLALAWVDQEKWVSCHVGDSRIYLIENNKIIWRTKDHTPVENMHLEGKISESVMYKHPMQNILLRTINTQVAPETDITLHPKLESNQSIIACTDGFWGNVSYSELSQLTQGEDVELHLSKSIESLIKNRQNLDNLTVIVLKPA